MRIICAWCHADLGHKCDHCGKPLIPADLVRETTRGRKTHTLAMICAEADPPFVYEVTERTKISHGICERCAALSDPERDQLIRDQRKQISRVHQSKLNRVLDAIEKRGPTGVSKAPTNPPEADTAERTHTRKDTAQ